ncbi:MAG: FAD-binding protein [bacterium]
MEFMHDYDAVIIGAGGAGLRAAIAARQEFPGKIAVVSKVFPTASGTSAARGGIGGALGREEKDSADWHIRDTIRGSDFLADRNAVETICQEAEKNIIELENMGVPFSRGKQGMIGQRRFAGHYGGDCVKPVKRACFCGDYSGQVIVQTLFDRCRQLDIDFFNEFQVLKLVIEEDGVRGFITHELASGELHIFNSPALLLAGGGAGEIYSFNSNARSTTGDLQALVCRAGIPLEDMEFVQFHPTALPGTGILVTEAARGAGGYLRNRSGERFMHEYAPENMELAPRDIVSRAIESEILAGRGINENCVHLDLRHLNNEEINFQLPELVKTARIQMGLNLAEQQLPVRPVAHYFMGGIPTSLNGQVLADGMKKVIPGLFAAGECACLSLHGANRLGTNSLLEVTVMGKRSGKNMARYADQAAHQQIKKSELKKWREKLTALTAKTGGPKTGALKTSLQRLMSKFAGVFRSEAALITARDKLREIEQLATEVTVRETGAFNYSLTAVFELKNMILLARTTVESALKRQESRGAHYRDDFPERDDKNWRKHSLVKKEDDSLTVSYKKVDDDSND